MHIPLAKQILGDCDKPCVTARALEPIFDLAADDFLAEQDMTECED